MANLQKFTRSGSKSYGNMLSHYERKIDSKTGEYIHFRSQDIDLTRTHLNYNIGPKRDLTQSQYIKKKLEEVHCLKRDDVKVMCTWVITKPTDLKEEDTKKFFEASYEFLKEKFCPYLKDDAVISSYVHMDEVSPHMHFAFMPIVPDLKKGGYKICSDKLTSREVLFKLHPEFQKFLQDKGLECSVQSFVTKEGNKTIEELKIQTAKNKLKQEKINEINLTLKEKVLSNSQIEKINVSKSITGAIKGISIEEIEKLKQTAKINKDYDSIIEKLLTENIKLKETLKSERENKSIEEIVKGAKLNSIKKELTSLKEKIANLPKEIQEKYFSKVKSINKDIER